MEESLYIKDILEKNQAWESYYSSNNERGYYCQSFLTGQQWDPNVKYNRVHKDRKETLVVNIVQKHLARALAEGIQTYGLKVYSWENKDESQIRAAKKILNSIIFASNNLEELTYLKAQVYKFGYGVLQIYADYENNYSLQIVPKIKCLILPEMAFFDKSATSQFKEDGRFCGLKRKIKAQDLKLHYKVYKKRKDLQDNQEIEVIDYWYKKNELINFLQKESGEWVREDRISKAANFVAQEARYINKVYFSRITNEEILHKDIPYYLDELPLMHIKVAEIVENSSEGCKEETIPYIYHMIGAQHFYNLAVSQVATNLKDMSGEKHIFTIGQISGHEQQFENFNTKHGAFVVNDPEPNQPPFPHHIAPEPVNPSAMHVMELAKRGIDEIAGINLNQEGAAKDGASSGVAVEARIQQGNILFKNMENTMVKLVNRMGRLIKEMLPKVVTNSFNVLVDGNLVTLNKKTDTHTVEDPVLENSIDKLAYDYDFTIEASSSTHMEKFKAFNGLLNLAKSVPGLSPYLSDIMVRNLEAEGASELARRLELTVPKEVNDYGKSEISKEEYEQIMMKKMQQKQQEKAGQVDPLMADVQMRAQNNQMNAQLKDRKQKTDYQIKIAELQQKALAEKDRVSIEMARVMKDNDVKDRDSVIKDLNTRNAALDEQVKILNKIMGM